MNQNPSNLLTQFFGKKEKYDLIEIYHGFMITYGYIPFEEFKKMDSWLVSELIHKINRDNKKVNSKRRSF